MTEQMQIYRCEVCGNVVEVLHAGTGTLVCCEQPMRLYEPNTTDAAVEKHVPSVEQTKEGVNVNVGSVAHPMEERHYIEWIEVIADGEVFRKFLRPGDTPKANFNIKADKITARAYCNIHGLWKA